MNRKRFTTLAIFMAFVFIVVTIAYPLIFNPDAHTAPVDAVPVAPPQPSPTAESVN